MARRTFFALLAIFSWFFADFSGLRRFSSVGDDGFLELRRIFFRSDNGGFLRWSAEVFFGMAARV